LGLLVGQLVEERISGDGGAGELNASLMTAVGLVVGLPWAFTVNGVWFAALGLRLDGFVVSGAGFCACVRARWDLRCGGWVLEVAG
jgi:hypothetical protein